MDDVARIVLAVESEHLAQDVIDFLDRTDRARVVDTVSDPDAVAEVIERERPDAVVGSPSLVPAGALNGSAFFAVSTEESVHVLRRAVELGARGFFLWPADRAALASATIRSAHPDGDQAVRRARVIAVYGPRGGAGTTFVATHLAAACARRGMETVLVDGDPAFGDLTWALGVPPDGDARTMAELEPVSEEISEEHLRNVQWTHPSGLRAILAPRDARLLDVSKAPCEAVRVASGMADVVTVHLPRAIDSSVSDLVQLASVLLVVVTLDVFAFRDAKRALEALEFGGRVEFVVNRATRGLIARSDVERVFGKPPLCVLPFERRVRDAQDRGELLPPRSRLGRAFARLASALVEEAG